MIFLKTFPKNHHFDWWYPIKNIIGTFTEITEDQCCKIILDR